MTDFTPLVRDAFQDDSLPTADRDRLWNTMEHRHTRQARQKLLVRAGLVLLASAILAAWVFLRMAPTTPGHPIAMHADSISMEHAMIQNDGRQEVPSNLMPLLGHRSQLTMEIQNLETKQLELVERLRHTSGQEHDVIARQLNSMEHQLDASRSALDVVDAQLAGHAIPVNPVPPMIAEIAQPPQVITVSGGGLSDELIWSSGGVGVLLVLAMLGMVMYMRRIMRLTREALTAVERQVSSQHATLASGIDAIAVEVERLGEGQRFMSKVLSGSEAKAPVSRT